LGTAGEPGSQKSESAALDGFPAGARRARRGPCGEFEYGGWQAPYFDEESEKVIGGQSAGLEALLLGGKTYEIFPAYWPKQPAENPIAARLNGTPKYVASRMLDTAGWTNSTLLQGDVAEAVARVKAQYGRVDVIGSGNLVQTLLRRLTGSPSQRETQAFAHPARSRLIWAAAWSLRGHRCRCRNVGSARPMP
jgi:dihydrofolate reductase